MMRRRPMPLRPRATRPIKLSSGDSRSGRGVAVALAADHPVGKLILEAPYTSIADVAASLRVPIVPVRWLLRDQFHSDERIARGLGAASDHAW